MEIKINTIQDTEENRLQLYWDWLNNAGSFMVRDKNDSPMKCIGLFILSDANNIEIKCIENQPLPYERVSWILNELSAESSTWDGSVSALDMQTIAYECMH